jgi:hypothetical protein
MKEAWLYESPFKYAIVRRIELIGWVFRDRQFHPSASWFARVRAVILILGGHETEICCICGRGVDAVWWCQDGELWARLTGWTEGGGCTCVGCFDRLADNAGVFLQWTARLHD